MQFGRVSDLANVDFSLPPLAERSRALLVRAPRSPGTWLRLGAPAFRHREWAGSLYPHEADQDQQLRIYASKLGALELNSTFYGLPSEATIERWIAETPEGFRFCPKVPRAISHELSGPDLQPLAAAFSRRVTRLGPRLGPALLQLPGSVGPGALDSIAHALDAFSPALALAVEVRNPGWFHGAELQDELRALLEARGISSVITDVAGRRDACHGSLTSSTAFVRFVGEGGHPSDDERSARWMKRLIEWRQAGLDQAYFFAHQPDDILAPQLLACAAEHARRAGVDVPAVTLEGPPKGQLDLFG